MEYIVVFPVFNSSEIYYCKSLDQVKQTIDEISITKEEIDEVRVFKIEKEIDVKNLI